MFSFMHQENEPIDRELVSKVGSDRMVAQFPRNISEVMIDSGAIFGVHNVYIVVPQLVSALISLGVTHYIDTNFATSTSITTGWCMLACSPGALVAAYLIMKKVPKLDAQYGLCGGEKPEKEAVVCAYPTNT